VGCSHIWWLYHGHRVREWGTRVVPCQWFALWASCSVRAVWHGHGCGGPSALALCVGLAGVVTATGGGCWCGLSVAGSGGGGWAMCCVPG
jgi:hypothetical protein